jgi:type I restriction enzyme, S subunit
MSLPTYGSYKESGVSWLGRIPADWMVSRLKNSISLCRNGIWGEEPNGDEDDIECVRVADFDRRRLVVNASIPTIRSVSQSERNGRLLSRGNLLLEKSGGGEKQPVGQVVLYDRDASAVCSNFVARVALNDGMVPKYWMYQHAAAYACGVNLGAIKQTSGIQNLDQAQYFNELGVFPSEQEQLGIANFLDRETAKIDALIAEQEKLLALLAEKRQATLSHAVTRGLNPDAPMKDSGIAWLGQIPAHWEMRRLKTLSPAITVGIVVNPSEYVSDSGLPYIYGGDIAEGAISTESCRRIDPVDSERQQKTRLAAGDLLTVRVGAPGVTAVVPVECDGGNCASVMLIRRGDFDSNWLCFAMNSRMVRYQVEVVQYGAAQEQFNIGHAINFWVATPPRDEQEKLADRLKATVERIDSLKVGAEQSIELLGERRSALVSAAVTGKIDVRGLS